MVVAIMIMMAQETQYRLSYLFALKINGFSFSEGVKKMKVLAKDKTVNVSSGWSTCYNN
jgi:hypothetical protein